jgi:hypothetical protein
MFMIVVTHIYLEEKNGIYSIKVPCFELCKKVMGFESLELLNLLVDEHFIIL